MSFSLSASGAVQQVKDSLLTQAEHHVDNGVDHVVTFIHNLVDRLEAPHGVNVSASGHTGADYASGTFSISPLPAPSSENPPAAPDSAVS